MKNPRLIISQPTGHKRGNPVASFPSILVDAETGEPIRGIGKITLNIPANGVLTCTAEVFLGGIEVVEGDGSKNIIHTEITADGKVVACEPLKGQDYITVHDALQTRAEENIGAKVEAAEAAGLTHSEPPLGTMK